MGCCKTKDAVRNKFYTKINLQKFEFEFFPPSSPRNYPNQITFGNFRRDSKSSFKTLGNTQLGNISSKNNYPFMDHDNSAYGMNNEKKEPLSPRFYFSSNANYTSNREFIDKKHLLIKIAGEDGTCSNACAENSLEGNYMSNFSLKNDYETIKTIELINTNNEDINFTNKVSDFSKPANNELKSYEGRGGEFEKESIKDKDKSCEDYKEEQEYIQINVRLPEESKSDVHALNAIPVNESLNTRLFNATKKLYTMGPFKKSNEIIDKAKELENQMFTSKFNINHLDHDNDDHYTKVILDKPVSSKKKPTFTLFHEN